MIAAAAHNVFHSNQSSLDRRTTSRTGTRPSLTLVVHTTAIAPEARLFLVVPSSGKMQVTERLHRNDTNHLQIDTVVEDPIALRMPWRYTRIYERSDTAFFERECDANNRDGNDQEPDLTPPR